MEEGKNKSGVPLDRGWAWVIVIAYFFSTFIMVGTAKSVGLFLPELVQYFNVELATAALTMGVSGAFYTFVAPVAVVFGELFSQRKVVIFGSIVGSTMMAISSLMLNIEFVIFFFGLGTGISNACLFGNGLVIMGQYFQNRRSLANGLGLAGASVGTFALPPLFQYLLDTYTLKGTLLLIAAIYLNICVFGALYRPISFYTKNRSKSEERQPLNIEDSSSAVDHGDKMDPNVYSVENHCSETLKDKKIALMSSTGSLVVGSTISIPSVVVTVQDGQAEKSTPDNYCLICNKYRFPKLFHCYVFKMPIVVFFIVFSFVVFFGYFNFILFLPYDVLSRGVTHYEKALMVSYVGLGDLLGRISVGILGDLNLIKRYKILATVCILCGVNILLIEIASDYWWMSIHAALYGYFGGCYVAINAIVLIDFVGISEMPKALSVVLLLQGLGAAIGQPVEGKIKDKTKSFSALNYINSMCLIIGGLFLFLYPLVKRFVKKQNARANLEKINIGQDEVNVSNKD